MLACQYDWQRELHNRSCWRYLRYRWSDRELVVRTEQRLFSQVHIRRIFRLGSPVSSIQVAIVIPLSSLTPNFSCLLTFSLIFLSLDKKRRRTTEKKKKKNCLLDEIVFVYFDFFLIYFPVLFFCLPLVFLPRQPRRVECVIIIQGGSYSFSSIPPMLIARFLFLPFFSPKAAPLSLYIVPFL